VNIILLGPPGSGKGTQGENLERKLGVVRISTGDLLREEVASGTEIGNKVKALIESGKLASNETVIFLLKNKIQSMSNGFILDGFPRNIEQADALDDMMKENDIKIDLVINFTISDEEIVKRISSRYFCTKCKATYNKLSKNPKKDGVCDYCGGNNFQTRADDTVETVKRRLEDYNVQTFPLVGYYKKQGILHNIDAKADIKDIEKEIEFILSKNH